MSKSKCLLGNIKSNKEQVHEATLHNDLSSLYQQPMLAAAPLSGANIWLTGLSEKKHFVHF